MTYRLVVARCAARTVGTRLPESVAAAALEFITGPLLENPQGVGKSLHGPLHDKWTARRGQYRIIYTIDDASRSVTVLQIVHSRGAYR